MQLFGFLQPDLAADHGCVLTNSLLKVHHRLPQLSLLTLPALPAALSTRPVLPQALMERAVVLLPVQVQVLEPSAARVLLAAPTVAVL